MPAAGPVPVPARSATGTPDWQSSRSCPARRMGGSGISITAEGMTMVTGRWLGWLLVVAVGAAALHQSTDHASLPPGGVPAAGMLPGDHSVRLLGSVSSPPMSSSPRLMSGAVRMPDTQPPQRRRPRARACRRAVKAAQTDDAAGRECQRDSSAFGFDVAEAAPRHGGLLLICFAAGIIRAAPGTHRRRPGAQAARRLPGPARAPRRPEGAPRRG